MLKCVRGLSIILSGLCLALATRTFADSESATMAVTVTVEHSCHVSVGYHEEVSVRGGADLTGRARPKIEVETSPGPTTTTPEGASPEPGLLTINF